jgi:hypothetical protein
MGGLFARSVRPSSRVDVGRAEAPKGLLVNKRASGDAGS